MQEPAALAAIQEATRAAGFKMASEPEVGALLRALAASKPGGRLLEIGTGTGVSAAWLLDGMDGASHLTSVDRDEGLQQIARRHLDDDPRVDFVLEEGREFLLGWEGGPFDLIFADAWSGKFLELDETLALLRPGGMYVADDLLPQPGWPDGHAQKVSGFLERILQRDDLAIVRLQWSTGVLLGTKR